MAVWPCVSRDHGTTGHWCPCGAHQRSITLNYHNHNERITGLQHCYGLVTTLLQPRDNMPVFRSSHAERDTVTRSHLYIWTPDGGGGECIRKKSQPPLEMSSRHGSCWCEHSKWISTQTESDDVMWCGGCGKYLYWIN